MLYIDNIINQQAHIINTDTNSKYLMSLDNLVLCCHNTGLRVQGVVKVIRSDYLKYTKLGYYTNAVTEYDFYTVFAVNEDTIQDNHGKYLAYTQYTYKCKLLNKDSLVYTHSVDDITQDIGNVGFRLFDKNDTTFDYMKGYYYTSYNYDSTKGIFKLSRRYADDIVCNLKELPSFVVPKFVDYIDFNVVTFREPCIIKIPNKNLTILNPDRATKNLILKVPKEVLYLYRNCDCLKLEYQLVG